jgi:transcriptional regulator with XRE-family HTH domain
MNDDLSETETDAPSSESPSETATGLPSLEDALAERAEKLGEFIRDQRRIARLSLRKLSDMAQISNPYLSQIERGLRKPSAEILQQLAKALRISAETLYVQAGILEERKDEPDLVSAIRREPTLTEAQKRALVQVLRSFQAENRVGGFGEQSS